MPVFHIDGGPIDKAIRDIATSISKDIPLQPKERTLLYDNVCTYLADYTTALLERINQKP
jgi:hypothetical protein